MEFRRPKISPTDKELQRIEREEQNLLRHADKHKSDPIWKMKLEKSNITFTLQNGMQLLNKQFSKLEQCDYEDALVIDKA